MPLEIKDIDGKKGIVTGYFSSFDNVDSDGDVIRKGAFLKTIREQGPNSKHPRIKHLLNHDVSKPLGVLTELKEDDKGLYYESKIGSHQLGQDFIKMVESDLVKEHSIGFRILKKNQLQDYEGYMKNPSAGWYELMELKLYEGSSLTGWGSNERTPLTGIKGEIDPAFLENRIKSLEAFCRNSDASEETIESLLIEAKQLSQLLITTISRSTTQAEKSLEPEKDDKLDELKAIIQITKQKIQTR